MTSTILVVDDDIGNRQTIELTLMDEGYRLEMAENGEKALDMIPQILPDVILLDIMMPGIDGYEVCRRVRRDRSTAEIPVVMLTALDDRESLLRGLESGADDFITKPFDRHELRARLASITRLNRYRSLVNERTRLAQALKDLEIAYDATLEGWSQALDLRDNETQNHSQRVMEMTVKMARRFGLSEAEVQQLRRGALLHDIGKMGVPDAILRKPGKLTDDEMKVMRKHPTYALKMLEHITYLSKAIDIPYCHHEKWDGTGYPRGLKGEQIPLSARMFAVIDVWDALLSDRPYRNAWTKERALEYIKQQSGFHFDPKVVEVFLDMLESWKD
jgi:putative two-component system response regulator